MEPTTPISIFFPSATSTPVTVQNLKLEQAVNNENVQEAVSFLHIHVRGLL